MLGVVSEMLGVVSEIFFLKVILALDLCLFLDLSNRSAL